MKKIALGLVVLLMSILLVVGIRVYTQLNKAINPSNIFSSGSNIQCIDEKCKTIKSKLNNCLKNKNSCPDIGWDLEILGDISNVRILIMKMDHSISFNLNETTIELNPRDRGFPLDEYFERYPKNEKTLEEYMNEIEFRQRLEVIPILYKVDGSRVDISKKNLSDSKLILENYLNEIVSAKVYVKYFKGKSSEYKIVYIEDIS